MFANPAVKDVVSSQTADSIFMREANGGMWTIADDLELDVYLFTMDGKVRVDDGSKARHEARSFETVADAFVAFPALRAYCEREAAKPTWQDRFRAALVRAADVAGCDISALQWEHASLDNTWGDAVGLVFWGASDACNKRAAEFFVAWAGKHGETEKLFGGYHAQRSVSLRGERHYARFPNGAGGWYDRPVAKPEVVETRKGYAASYVYYPCAD